MRNAAAIVLLAVAALAAVGASAADARRPNVVVIETDDQTASSLWAMPTVDRLLARQGVTFDNSFVSFPLCCPSRATFLTGQYAHNHGVMNNRPPGGGYEKLRGDETLPVWLQRAGYRTILIGKYLNGYGMRDPTEVPPGWSEWHGLVDPSTYHYYAFRMNENGRVHRFPREPVNYQTRVLTRKAVNLIRGSSADDRPFFMWTTYLAPHYAFGSVNKPPTPVPGPRDRGTFATEPLPESAAFDEADVSDKPTTVRQYPRLSKAERAGIRKNYVRELESLQAVDRGVGRIVAELRAQGELDRTLIAFTSDNGYLHGEHRVPFGKMLPYEPSIRVPLVVRGPGVRRNVHVPDLVSNQDMAPTILDVAGAEPGVPQDGLSLMGVLGHGDIAQRPLLIEGFYPFGQPVKFAGIRTKLWFYAEYTNGERELYDLSADPDELVNVSGDPSYAEVEADLARRLEGLRKCAGAACSSDEARAGRLARVR